MNFIAGLQLRRIKRLINRDGHPETVRVTYLISYRLPESYTPTIIRLESDQM